MTCPTFKPTFQLLDRHLGFTSDGSTPPGFSVDAAGLHLPDPSLKHLNANLIDNHLLPPWLAHARSPSTWFLLTPARRLLKLTRCETHWHPAQLEINAMSLSANCHRLAIATSASVEVFDAASLEHITSHSVPNPTLVALAHDNTFWVVSRNTLLHLNQSGQVLESLTLPASDDQPSRLQVDAASRPWLALGTTAITQVLFHVGTWQEATAAQLRHALAPTKFQLTGNTFCLTNLSPVDPTIPLFFTRAGCESDAQPKPLPISHVSRTATYVSPGIDSTIPGCVWHRIQISADIATGTFLSLSAIALEDPDIDRSQLDESDWFHAPINSLDTLLRCPPGRYLYLRIKFETSSDASPQIHRIRIDYPRESLARFLPEVFVADPTTSGFTHRLLSLLAAPIETIDSAIASQHTLLDPSTLPAEHLPWLAALLGVTLHPAWTVGQSRAILALTPRLNQSLSTIQNLHEVCKIILDVEPSIEELAPSQPWGALSHHNSPSRTPTRLGSTRLYRATALRLNRSQLGLAALRTSTDPIRDALDSHGNRVLVSIPTTANAALDAQRLSLLQHIFQTYAPAHLSISFHIGTTQLALTGSTRVGIDTNLLGAPAPVLSQSTRLNRAAVLRPRAAGHYHAPRAGIDFTLTSPIAIDRSQETCS